jgi:hypothetical protein
MDVSIYPEVGSNRLVANYILRTFVKETQAVLSTLDVTRGGIKQSKIYSHFPSYWTTLRLSISPHPVDNSGTVARLSMDPKNYLVSSGRRPFRLIIIVL